MFDIIIQNGKIFDGSGNPWCYGDVGVRGDRIASMGKLSPSDARVVIDAKDRAVCPGFIDMHTHSDVMLLANPSHEPKIAQGVTTDVIGLDGLSYAPLSPPNLHLMRSYLSALNGNPDIAWDWQSVGEFLNRFDGKVAANVAYLIPHNALRLETVGFEDRSPSADELKKMQEAVTVGMKQGAFGFSTGLDYFPCRYSETRELIAICETVAELGGLSVWHIRGRDLGLMDAIKEVLSVGEATGVKVHFSHFAANGPKNKGKSTEMLQLIDDARDRGLDVSFDAYSYRAASTTLLITIPRWVHEGGPEAMIERFRDPEAKKKMCDEMLETESGWEDMTLSCAPSPKHREYIGKPLTQGAEACGKNVAEFVCDLLMEENLNAGFVNFVGNEPDIQGIMQHPCHTGSSDGILVGEQPNPRGWGTFPRFISEYWRNLGLLSLEEMIRHLTAAPAQRLGLSDRGLIKKGLAADLVVFDPDTIQDTATFENPKQHPQGIDYVLVNGKIVVGKGAHTGALNGRALRH